MTCHYVEGGGSVELLSVFGNDLNVVNVARVSMNKWHDEWETEEDENDERLMTYLHKNEHTSPFRHQYLQFRIEAPIFVLRQWMKHTIGCGWNEQSGRYVSFSFECHKPDRWRKQSKSVKQGSGGAVSESVDREATLIYDEQIRAAYDAYKRLLELGVCKEQARTVLPLSLMTKCIWTCSLQAFLHFLHLRLNSHAQVEIQNYAQACLRAARAEGSFENALRVAGL